MSAGNTKSQKDDNQYSIHHQTLICNLSKLTSQKIKITGIVLQSSITQSYFDIKITDGTGDIECSHYFDKDLRQFYQIPKIGQFVFLIGAFNRKQVGNKIFDKIKIQRFSIQNNVNSYLQFVMRKIKQQQQSSNNQVQIIGAFLKKPKLRKLFQYEARNLIFICMLIFFQNNPELKFWTFSKQSLKNQQTIRKYLTLKSINPQQSSKQIQQAIEHFLKYNLLSISDMRYSVNKSIFTKLQQQAIKIITNAGCNGINYGYLIELLHRPFSIQKQSQHIFSIQGLSKLLDNQIKSNIIYTHENKLILM